MFVGGGRSCTPPHETRGSPWLHQLRPGLHAMFEGVYITDDKNNLCYEYLVFPHVPSFSAVAGTLKAKFSADHLALPSQLVEVNLDYLVARYGSPRVIIYLLCLTREFGRHVNPLFPFLFLDMLVDTMGEYFGLPLTTLKIDANNDTLTLLLHQMIANGVPNTTDLNTLRDLVSLKSFLSKILLTGNQLASAANAKSISSIANPRSSPFTASSDIKPERKVPWRSANVRYTNNEMFVDVVESLNVILTPKARSKRYSRTQNFDSAFYSSSGAALVLSNKLSVLSGSISGKLEFLSHISGVPELQIVFNSAANHLDSPQFHRCINLQAWHTSKALSFVPADGRSVLMNYAVDLDALPATTKSKMLGLLEFDYEAGLGLDSNEMELRIHTAKDQAVTKVDTVEIEVFAREPTNGILEPSEISGMKPVRVTDGDFRYKGSGSGVWTIQNLQTGSHPVLRLAIKSLRTEDDKAGPQKDLLQLDAEKSEPLRPVWFRVNFLYKGQVPSGLRVDSMKVVNSLGLGESVKPYKGVKYMTNCADYTIRC